MAKYTGPQCRLCRREGVKLYLKGARCFSTKCPIEKRGGQIPGVHGKRYSRRLSDYGAQLREKQKVKRLYQVLEKQFARYYELATKSPSNTGVRLLQLLETRLDNTVYRSGLVTNRSDARQLVAHGNVLVNGKKVSVPSFQVKTDSVISIAPKATSFDAIKQAVEAKINPPKWIETKGAAAHVLRLPERAEIGDDINERLIIEYYSR